MTLEDDSIVALMRDDWPKGPDAGVMTWIYAVREVSANTLVVDLGDVRVAVVSDELRYMPRPLLHVDVVETNDDFGIGVRLATEALGVRALPPAVRLLLLTPVRLEGKEQVEAEQDARARLAVSAGLLATIEGRALLLTKISESIVRVEANDRTQHVATATFFPPPRRRPDLSSERADVMERLSSALQSLPTNDAQRIRLSLEWFESVFDLSDQDPVESCLRTWIALEALAMPGDSDIKPINEHLAVAYGMSVPHAAKRFLVGKLFGLRSSIVHHGRRPAINATVLLHMQAIYTDVLFQVLGSPCERRAQTSLDNTNVRSDLDQALAG